MQAFLVRPRTGALLAVSTLFASAPAALGGTAVQPSEEPELVLGAEEARPEQEYSFDILAPGLAPAAAPAPAAPSAAQSYYDDHESGMFFRVGGGLITAEESDGPDEEIDFDEGYLVDLAVGHRFAGAPNNLAFDLEVEGIWTDQDTDEEGGIESISDVTVLGALLNGMADYRLAQHFSIYGGAGIGAAFMDIGTQSDALNDFDDEDGPFLTWQGKAGVKFLTSGGGAFNLGYRFLNVDDVEIDDDVGDSEFDLETIQHGLEIGYTFGHGATY